MTIYNRQNKNRLTTELPDLNDDKANADLCALYGVKDVKNLDSANLLLLSLAIGGIGCIVAIVIELI